MGLWLRRGILGIVAIFCIVLLSACGGAANIVHVYDNARVLDQNRVQSEASTLPSSIDIYTVNTFTGSKSAFDQTTRGKLGNNPNLIVVAIDTVHHHMAIVRGSNVSLSSSQIQSAISAFAGNYGNGDYTGATIASVDSMRNSLGTGGGSSVLVFLLVAFLVIVGIFLLIGFFMRWPRTVILALYIEPEWLKSFRPGWVASGAPGFFRQPSGEVSPRIRGLAMNLAADMMARPEARASLTGARNGLSMKPSDASCQRMSRLSCFMTTGTATLIPRRLVPSPMIWRSGSITSTARRAGTSSW